MEQYSFEAYIYVENSKGSNCLGFRSTKDFYQDGGLCLILSDFVRIAGAH